MILGIGNQLRGDDFLGSVIARELIQKSDCENSVIIDGGTVPENFTGVIKKENPSHIILIDAADMNRPPGYIKIIEKDDISQYNISTHAMPLSFLMKYLEHTTKAQIILIGIQPKDMELVDAVSPEIKKSVEYVVDLIYDLINES